jgi:phosphate transport system substrate-binding protein
MTTTFKATATLVALLLAGTASAQERISIVGSSTVFPFATTVAEHFGKAGDFATPVVESTGSGGGLKLFCAGVGLDTPDITNASRRIKASEVERCAANGVTEITEVKIGYDGIVLANARTAQPFALSMRDIFLALAANVPDGNGGTMPNPYETWADVNPDLPAINIEVMGPPPTSGTRDAFAELAMEGGCKTFDWIAALKHEDKAAYKALCHTLREDGAYIEAGENDNLIVQKLVANPDALGIFGYSFLEENADRVQGSTINGVAPEFDAISSGDYPVSRSLYFYVKNAHVGQVPGMEEYIAEFTDEDTWGEYGYLAEKGLIPMGEDEMAQFAEDAANLTPLEM